MRCLHPFLNLAPQSRKSRTSVAPNAFDPCAEDPLFDPSQTQSAQAAIAEAEAEAAAEAERAARDEAERRALAAYKHQVEVVLTEFFVSHDFDEALAAFRALQPPARRPEIAKRVLLLSMDRSDTDRELASRLLSALYGDVLTIMHIAEGFQMLFELGSELETDTPGAIGILARFLARAVVDEVLPPSFLMDADVEALGGPVITEAKTLLSARHAALRLEHVWGAAAAAGVAELKEQVRMMTEELFDEGSPTELERCVRELNAPRFHHEVVKRVIVVAVGRGEKEQEAAVSALTHLGQGGVGLVSESEAERGLRRVKAELPDLALDTPAAPGIVEALVAKLRAAGVISPGADLAAAASAARAGTGEVAAAPAPAPAAAAASSTAT